MKKVFRVLLVLLIAMVPFVGVNAKTKTTTTTTTEAKGEAINFYEFYGATCSHCAELNEWIESTLAKDSDYNYKYNLVKYEVWSNQTNADLMVNVGTYLNVEATGVPFMVIGDQALSGFSASASPDQIKAAIDKAYNANKAGTYKDVVAGIGQGTIDVSDADKDENGTKKTNDIIGYVIIGIVVLIIVAIIFGRSKSDTYYPVEEEDDEDEEVEEKEEEVKPVAKKVAVKKPVATKTASKSTAKKTTKTTSTKKTTAKKNTKKK